MNWTARRRRFRALLQGDACTVPLTVFDPMSARMLEELGHPVGMLAGSVAAMAILGAPDKVLITASEFVDMAHRICRAGDLAVLADADHGYGNALNVTRTVGDLEHAGLAGLTIEDTHLPQPFGTTTPQLLSIEEGVAKMQAAVAGRTDPDFVVLGRTSAPGISGREDTLARIRAYAQTGVDAICLIGVSNDADLDAFCAATDLPLMLGNPKTAYSLEQLAERGVRICLKGHQPYMAMLQATYDTMRHLRGELPDSPPLMDAALVKRLVRDEG